MIEVKKQDGIAEILIANPPINGITDELLDTLMGALRMVGDDPHVRAIVLGSAIPGRFCGGLDLPKFRKSAPSQVHATVSKLYYHLWELQSSLPKPTIAAITGAVRGGGMSIAITCDMLVAADNASFGYPELDVGLLPAIHFNHLPRVAGRHRAFDLLFTGRVFDAREAMNIGLVSRVVPEHEVLTEAHKVAQVFVTKSPALMRLGKAAFGRATENGYRYGAAAAVDLVSTVFGTEDCQAGLAAFEEKRKPVWGKD